MGKKLLFEDLMIRIAGFSKFHLESKYKSEDIRKTIHLHMFDALRTYMAGISLMLIINDNKIEHIETNDEDMKIAKLFLDDQLKDYNLESYFNNISIDYFMRVWNTFESCIKTLTGTISNENPKNSIFKHLKLLNEKYQIDKKESKSILEIIEFCTSFRNTLHAKFLYRGEKYDYQFRGVDFKFRDKYPLYIKCPLVGRSVLFAELSYELSGLFLMYGSFADTEVIIPDPLYGFSDKMGDVFD